jgi:hypothetical protein
MSTTDHIRARVSAQPLTHLLTPAEVAAALQVTPKTVQRYAVEGLLTRIRLGGRLSRYTPENVEALIVATRELKDQEPAGNGLEVTTIAGCTADVCQE